MAGTAGNYSPDWMYFVGKWGDVETGHPLVYHLLDSAAVARLLFEQGLTGSARKQFSHWLQLPEKDCCNLLSFWTSLHDLGKAAPTFQCKHTPTRNKLENLGYIFQPIAKTGIRHHSLLSQWILKDFKENLNIQPLGEFNRFRYAIGGHHGTFHVQEDKEETEYVGKNLGDHRWKQARAEMYQALHDLLKPPSLPVPDFSDTDRNAFFNLLTGFFVTADWIASQDDLFTYCPASGDLDAYWDTSQKTARTAMIKTGWIGWKPDAKTLSFNELFSFPPNSLQKNVNMAVKTLQDPFFMIIEAPTGSGKTEAAFSVADHAIRTNDMRGFYIAMPTQATSDQMYGRTRKFLSKRYRDQKQINLLLVYGNAISNQEYQKMRVASVYDQGEISKNTLEDETEGNVNALEWFLPRKRSLLAPFGVGTVDQTFYSVLRARHSFLRLFGLYRKVVIFDEVHAYDVYMQEIFSQLLAWLRAIGSSVIILSATLPDTARMEFLQVYQPTAEIKSSKAKYPRLSMNDGKTISTISLGDYRDRAVALDFRKYEAETWIDTLREKLSDGGCAAIICNRVDRAQEVFCHIRNAHIVDDDRLLLLHARFPNCWRKDIEEKILGMFAKKEHPEDTPRKGIVVATQIIEQSLDLDFDLLITDLAPVDLLIQRIGRLHRHTGKNYAPHRPDRLRDPLCIICQPEKSVGDSNPDFGKDCYIYDKVILQRTWFVMSGRGILNLPSDSDDLINTVYSDCDLPQCSQTQSQILHQNYRNMLFDQANETGAARNRMIGDVDLSDAVGGKTDYLKENDAGVSDAMQALTRNNILKSVQLVCMYQEGDRTFLLDKHFAYSINEEPGGEALEHLLRSMVSVSKREVVDYFDAQPRTEAWRRQPSVRYAHPVIFIQGEYDLGGGKKLKLDEKFGLIVKERNDELPDCQ